jgi:membrane-associated HD superfamily phosphohydrolase
MSFERNPHDDLAPTMSALIIIAHVKKASISRSSTG